MIDPGADRSRLAGANAIGKSGGLLQPAVSPLRVLAVSPRMAADRARRPARPAL